MSVFSSFFYQQFHDTEIGLCRYFSPMRFYHQKGIPHCWFMAYCGRRVCGPIRKSMSVYRLPFYVYKYCAILCWHVIVEVGAAPQWTGKYSYSTIVMQLHYDKLPGLWYV